MPTATSSARSRSRSHNGISIPPGWFAASVALFLTVWFLASAVAGAKLLPSPLTVAQSFYTLLVEPLAGLTLPWHVLSSLTRWGTGFLIAVAIGVPLGITFGAIGPIREFLSPIFEFLRFIPPFAWIPLAILWMGSGQTSAAFIVFVAAFPAVVISTQVGIATIDRRLSQAALNLGAGPFQLITRVLAPLGLPSIFTGIRVAVSNGWMAVVAAEMIGGTEGIGFLIIQGQENGDVPIVITGMVAIGITGAIIEVIVALLRRVAIPWSRTDD